MLSSTSLSSFTCSFGQAILPRCLCQVNISMLFIMLIKSAISCGYMKGVPCLKQRAYHKQYGDDIDCVTLDENHL